MWKKVTGISCSMVEGHKSILEEQCHLFGDSIAPHYCKILKMRGLICLKVRRLFFKSSYRWNAKSWRLYEASVYLLGDSLIVQQKYALL